MIYLQDTDFTLYCGDALEVLRGLPAESVHMCVTSPPFYGLRDYGMDGQIGLEETPEQWVSKLVDVFREVRRVLRKDGSLWLEVGDSYAANGLRSTGRNDTDRETPGGRGGSFRGGERHEVAAATPGLKPKDLIGAPWMLAFALRADGWYLRSDIIWSRPNPMPESVTDRPTKSHSYVFLLSKSPRYYWDAHAISEAAATPPGATWEQRKEAGATAGNVIVGDEVRNGTQRVVHGDGSAGSNLTRQDGRRNIRSVWQIATQPYPDAHFATYPEELVRRCILAGTSERGCCPECGAPWRREVEISGGTIGASWHGHKNDGSLGQRVEAGPGNLRFKDYKRESLGWLPSCEHGQAPIPCTVLDLFGGSGTTALVARKHGRRSILIELNEQYCELAAERTRQLSLLGELA